MSAKTPEGKIKAAIVAYLKSRGAKVLVTTGVAQAGCPDLICCLKSTGRGEAGQKAACLALEVKIPGEDATPKQRHELMQWWAAGATVGTVHSVEEVEELLAGEGL